jgi:hypothetical protein
MTLLWKELRTYKVTAWICSFAFRKLLRGDPMVTSAQLRLLSGRRRCVCCLRVGSGMCKEDYEMKRALDWARDGKVRSFNMTGAEKDGN